VDGILKPGTGGIKPHTFVSPVPGLSFALMPYRGFASPHPRLAAVIALRLITAFAVSKAALCDALDEGVDVAATLSRNSSTRELN